MPGPPVWLRGPLAGFPPPLMPVAHALLQAREDLEEAVRGVPPERLWMSPGTAAPAGFHIQHLAGSLDRLLTYARGHPLNAEQLRSLGNEKAAGASSDTLLELARTTIDRALEQLRRTDPETLFEPREVGRARLPSTVLGLLVHAAEHTARHVGQVTTTLKAVTS